jgi:hypothetical protein
MHITVLGILIQSFYEVATTGISSDKRAMLDLDAVWKYPETRWWKA